MYKRIFRFLLSLWNGSRLCKKTESWDKDMATKALLPKRKITIDEFERATPKNIYMIKRVGKGMYIMQHNKAVDLTRSNIQKLSENIIQSNSTAKIITMGLSRAQVGRVAGDIQAAVPEGVYIRKADSQDSRKLLTYEILVDRNLK